MVKEGFSEIESHGKSDLYLKVNQDTQASRKRFLRVGKEFFLDFWFQRFAPA
jgi:hypothetical protein